MSNTNQNPEANSTRLHGAEAYVAALRKIGADEQTIRDAEAAAERVIAQRDDRHQEGRQPGL